MLNEVRLQETLISYKQAFVSELWPKEKYKWEAVKHFQENWDINASDFLAMLNNALAKTENLLVSRNYFPAGMLRDFAGIAPEELRAMFLALFDESQDLFERIDRFKTKSAGLLERFNSIDSNNAKNHYQDVNAISTYLWLRYPDKYFIYKFSETKAAARALNYNKSFKKGAYADNVRNFLQFYNEISLALEKDEELVRLFRSELTDSCYPDPKLHTLTIDFGRFTSQIQLKAPEEVTNDWFPADYNPGFSVEDWVELLADESVFLPSSLEIMKRLKDIGGQATCSELALKYGEKFIFYITGSTNLARRIYKKTNCPLLTKHTENSKWWPVLYIGKRAAKEDTGLYIWKLREELSQALDRVDLSQVALYENPGPAFWKLSLDIEDMELSQADRQSLAERRVVAVPRSSKTAGQSKTAQGKSFLHSIKIGDFFYLCYGSSIQLLGQFTSEKAVPSQELQEGWLEREYQVLAVSLDTAPYNQAQKTWTPNESSYCVKIEGEEDLSLFEKLILQPYFGQRLSTLLNEPKSVSDSSCWYLSTNPKSWSLSEIAVGKAKLYPPCQSNAQQSRLCSSLQEAKAGDTVILAETGPVRQIVALGTIRAKQKETSLFIEKTEGLTSPLECSSLNNCQELKHLECLGSPQSSLSKLTSQEYDLLMELIREENPQDFLEESDRAAKYDKSDFLQEVYMPEGSYDRLVALLLNKKNIILQGAPGVGKTFTAKRLAYSLMGVRDDSRVEMVQLHESYSYEDFMLGFKPTDNGFALKYGIFYRFCQRAANWPDKQFFFIIDEINRGNLSKIFGELLLLIERDYRGTGITLAYNGLSFAVPPNLYLIGMMNTADRSLAMIDYALRRRFSFVEIEPGFDSEGFCRYLNELNNDTLNELVNSIKELNKEITADRSLGKGFCLGHSCLCGQKSCSEEWLRSVVDYDILPMLSEYWFDDNAKLIRWENRLHGLFQ